MNNIQCNKCGNWFALDRHYFDTVQEGDFVVQFFSCPACGMRFQVFTSDKEMRELVERRKIVQQKIHIGHAKKFSRKALHKYEQELEKIKRKQEKMMPTFKVIGEKILHGEGGGQDAQEVHRH